MSVIMWEKITLKDKMRKWINVKCLAQCLISFYIITKQISKSMHWKITKRSGRKKQVHTFPFHKLSQSKPDVIPPPSELSGTFPLHFSLWPLPITLIASARMSQLPLRRETVCDSPLKSTGALNRCIRMNERIEKKNEMKG